LTAPKGRALVLANYQRRGLGISPGLQTGEQAANLALNFIPGVGPFLSAGAQLLEGIFQGGSDPTPIYELEERVLAVRAQLAALHAQMGTPDAFHLVGPIGSGQNPPSLIQSVVTEGNGHPVASGDWRKGLYTALQTFQGEVAQLGPQAHDQQLLSEFRAMLPPSSTVPGSSIMQVSPPSSAAPTSSSPYGTPSTMPAPVSPQGATPPSSSPDAMNPPTGSTAIAGAPPALMIGIVGALVLVFAMSGSNGGKKHV
jgi:hypothetical protein